MPSIKLVSKFWINVRINPISFLVLSNITCGSELSHRKQFGAITMAKLLTSIFVTFELSSAANTLINRKKNRLIQNIYFDYE